MRIVKKMGETLTGEKGNDVPWCARENEAGTGGSSKGEKSVVNLGRKRDGLTLIQTLINGDQLK